MAEITPWTIEAVFSMRQITDYCIVSADFQRSIADDINTLIGEGWQPYGPLVVTEHLIKMQVMVRYAAQEDGE